MGKMNQKFMEEFGSGFTQDIEDFFDDDYHYEKWLEELGEINEKKVEEQVVKKKRRPSCQKKSRRPSCQKKRRRASCQKKSRRPSCQKKEEEQVCRRHNALSPRADKHSPQLPTIKPLLTQIFTSHSFIV